MLYKLKKFILQMMVGANITAILLMLLVGYTYKLNPTEHPVFSSVGLGFPVMLAVNAGFLILFLVFKRRMIIIPVLGFVVCYVPIRKYSPLNVWRSTPDDAIKVMSYNVFFFNSEDSTGLSEISGYVNESGASIVCMQEANFNEEVRNAFKDEYQYMDTTCNTKNGEIQLILSKYPILSKTRINAELPGCLCAAYEVLINGDRTTVVNCHLEGSGLSLEERSDFNRFVRGKWEDEPIRAESKKMIVRLGKAARNRVPQVEGIIKYIKSRKDEPVLLFGDFNDNPISYCHELMANTLTDCYVATANGPGISYHYNAIYVRIDNIMCSAHWQPYNFKVDRDIAVSDHYPIWGFVKKSQQKGKKSL